MARKRYTVPHRRLEREKGRARERAAARRGRAVVAVSLAKRI